VAGRGNDFDVFEANGAKAGGDEIGRAADVRCVLGERADAGNPQEVFQLVEQSIFVGLDEGVSRL
jgi:hypothetical protein